MQAALGGCHSKEGTSCLKGVWLKWRHQLTMWMWWVLDCYDTTKCDVAKTLHVEVFQPRCFKVNRQILRTWQCPHVLMQQKTFDYFWSSIPQDFAEWLWSLQVKSCSPLQLCLSSLRHNLCERDKIAIWIIIPGDFFVGPDKIHEYQVWWVSLSGLWKRYVLHSD